MLAKPIIDILLGYKSDQEFENYKTYLVANGYRYRGCPHEIGDHIFIFVSENDIQTHKVHMVEFLGDLWKEKIKFRDILRKNKSVCERYSQFKKELASQYGHSRKEYTRRKGHLIEEILKQR